MMVDVHDNDSRRRNMAAIRGKNTKPELLVRQICHAQGFRFRLHRKDLPGKPDLVFPKYNAAIFVNGCFWHGHDCKRGARTPKANRAYWEQKIARNRARDADAVQALEATGWRTLVVWECELRDDALPERLAQFLGPRGAPRPT